MKLYRTKFFDNATGVAASKWSGTQADAREDRKTLKEAGHSDIDTKEVDVPTSKSELLAWLNENVTGE